MLTERIHAFREKITNGPVLGPFSKTEDPAIVEAMGYAGMDFVILDLEHGPNTVRSLQGLLRAAESADIFPIVRVKENVPSLIGEVLDIGAGGIQVPQITNADKAREVIRHAKFAPHGMRGVCRFVRAANYSDMDRFEYFKKANDVLIILQIEGEEAIANIDSILEVQGIDVIFIGPYDLSQSLGIPGQIDHPQVFDRMAGIIDACKAKGVVVGTFADTVKTVRRWKELDVHYLAYSVDIGILLEKCKELVSAVM